MTRNIYERRSGCSEGNMTLWPFAFSRQVQRRDCEMNTAEK